MLRPALFLHLVPPTCHDAFLVTADDFSSKWDEIAMREGAVMEHYFAWPFNYEEIEGETVYASGCLKSALERGHRILTQLLHIINQLYLLEARADKLAVKLWNERRERKLSAG
jgi:hypothetical protein